MKKDYLARTEILLGEEAIDRLGGCRVAVFGIGGVGGHVCEALVRSGIGAFDLVDKDVVSITNLNRQIIALRSTIGKSKVSVMKDRMLDIAPETHVRTYECFFTADNSDEFDFSEYDYVVDAVDTVAAKIEIIMKAREAGVPVISSMGAGNKLDPGRFRIADIYDTSVCPLARVIRREMRARGVDSLKVVYSEEPAIRTGADETGSTSFVPAAAGLMIAGEVIRDLVRR